MKRVALAILLTTSLCATVRADDSPQVDVAAQISPRGLRFLASEIPRYLPTTFNASGFTSQLVDCPFTEHDTDLTVSKVRTSFQVRSLDITPTTDRLTVGVEVRGGGTARVKVTRPYGCVGYPLTCVAGFEVKRAVASASFSPKLQAGKVRLKDPKVALFLSKHNISITVSDCGFAGTLATLILPLFNGYIAEQVVDNLETVIRDEVPPQVESLLSGLTHFNTEVPSFDVSGQLTAVRSRHRGVAVGAGFSITPTETGSCSLPTAPTPMSAGLPSISDHNEHLAVAVARSALDKALLALWRAGGLCGEAAELEQLGVTHQLPGWGAFLLGLSGGGDIAVHTHQAPQVELMAGPGAQVRVTLPEVLLQIDGTGPNGPTTITAKSTAKLELQLRLEPETRSVVLEVLGADVSGIQLSATDPQGLRLQPAVVSALVRGLVLPLVEQRLSGMEVGPQVLHEQGGLLDPYFLNLSRGTTTGRYLYLYADVFRRPTNDHTAPVTSLKSHPITTTETRVRLTASGSDGGTPAALLRYRWRVDGGPWSAASYASTFSVDLDSGHHTIEVRAVDLSGNADPTPARLELEVKPGGVGKGDLVGWEEGSSSQGGCAVANRPTVPISLLPLLLLLALVRRSR